MGFGRTLTILGALLLVVGLVVTVCERTYFPIGRLPGDLELHGKNWSFYFPLATSLLLSLLATAVMWFLRRR